MSVSASLNSSLTPLTRRTALQLRQTVCAQNETAYHAVDGHVMNDRQQGKKRGAGKDKKVDLDNLKREVEMVRASTRS